MKPKPPKPAPPVKGGRTFVTAGGRFLRTTEEAAEAMVQGFAETFAKHHPGAYEHDDEEYPNDE